MYAQHQAALIELTQAVRADVDQPRLLQQAVALVADTLAVPYCSLWELAADTQTLVLRASIGWRTTNENPLAAEATATTLAGAAVLYAAPVIIEDWASETVFQPMPSPGQPLPVSSVYVSVPGRPLPFGSLGVDVPANRLFSDEEVNFLQAIANILALASDRAQTNRAIYERAASEERQRLARDLHDTVIQALYGITLHAEAAQRSLVAGETTPALGSLQVLHDAAQSTLDEMRLLIFELRPPLLAEQGLVAALQTRLETVESRADLETTLITNEYSGLAPAIEQELYRIAQEALNNALKHARAHHIGVRLQQTPTAAVLEISDDGVGFEATTASASGGVGLQGIAERVALLKGTHTIHHTLGAGTQLRVEIPL